jgi:hypothetical protein
MAEWAWVESAHRYRNKETGRFLSASAERELRDDFVARTAGEVSTLAGRVASEEIGPDAWERGVRSHVRLVNTAQYLFGRGGRNAMTEDDTAALAEIVRDQWTYLGRFADDVAGGTMSEAQIRAGRSSTSTRPEEPTRKAGRPATTGWCCRRTQATARRSARRTAIVPGGSRTTARYLGMHLGDQRRRELRNVPRARRSVGAAQDR